MERSREMSIFVRVVENGSFSAAARTLGITPSGVSKMISRLEDRLGVLLFKRTTRRLRLSDDGKLFYHRCRAILHDIEQAEIAVSRARQEPQGLLRIASTTAFGNYQLVYLIPEFQRRYPSVQVDLTFSDVGVDLMEAGADVGVFYGHLPESSMIVHHLVNDRRIIVASPQYITRFGAPMTPDELSDHQCLCWSRGQKQLNRWRFDGGRVVTVRGGLSADTGEAMVRLAMAGAGLMRLAEFVAGPLIQERRLVPLLSEYNREDRLPIYAIYLQRRLLPLKVRAFLDFLDEKLTPVPPWVTFRLR